MVSPGSLEVCNCKSMSYEKPIPLTFFVSGFLRLLAPKFFRDRLLLDMGLLYFKFSVGFEDSANTKFSIDGACYFVRVLELFEYPDAALLRFFC